MSTRELIDMCSKSAGRRRDWALWCAEQQNPAELWVGVSWAFAFRGRNLAYLPVGGDTETGASCTLTPADNDATTKPTATPQKRDVESKRVDARVAVTP